MQAQGYFALLLMYPAINFAGERQSKAEEDACNEIQVIISAPFNNMQTLKFEARPTNAFFSTVNQMFGGSSQLSTTAERAVIKSSSTGQTRQ